jgi:hypothetical protein
MELPEITDSLDPIPEAFRVNYQPTKDGKFELKHVAGLRANNTTLLSEKRGLVDKYKVYDGIDPNSVEEMKQVYGQHKDSKLTDKEKAEKALKERDDKIASLEAKDRSRTLKDGLREVMINAGIFEGDVDDVLSLTAGRFDLDKDGNIVAKDVADGAPDKFFGETYKKQRPKFYKPEGGGGSGASNTQKGGSGASKTITRSAFFQLSPTEQAETAKTHTVVD